LIESTDNPQEIRVSPQLGRRARRLLIGCAILLVVWLAASLFVAHKLTSRRRPMFAEPVPTVAWGSFEPHRLKTRDGQEIGAWFHRGRPDAPSVLLLHGNGGSRRACLSRAEILARQGHAVLLISLRAHGDSTGDINDIGYSARHDVIAAVELLKRERPGRPVIIHGTSMGAAAALFASSELANRIRGYILESPYQDLKTAVRNRTENELPPLLDWIAYRGLVTVAPLILPDVDKISPLSAIDGVPTNVPVLILAGGNDRNARPEEARALLDRVKGHGRLVLFEKAGHLRFLDEDPELYKRTILEFIEERSTSP
jgi:alpha-beta hydrolase superfamily lysophospholipase